MNKQSPIERLPSDYREQKSREQAAFQAAARGNPEMCRRAHVLSGLAKDAVIIEDPSLLTFSA